MPDKNLKEEFKKKIKERMRKKPSENSEGEDILILMEGTESSQTVVNALAEPLINKEIRSVEAKSELGREIIERVPSASLPFHVVEEDGKYKQGDLSELIRKHTGA